MKISSQTAKILKNFAAINSGIKFKKGSDTIRTVSAGNNIFVSAKIAETFDKEFCLHELGRLLSILDLLGPDAEVSADEHVLRIEGAGYKTKMRYWHEETLHLPPDREINLTNPVVQFSIPNSKIEKIKKGAAIQNVPTYGFIANGKSVILKALDENNDSSDTMETELGETDKVFKLYVAVEALDKMLPGSYEVTFFDSVVKAVKLDHKEIPLSYVFALKSESELGDNDDSGNEDDDAE